MGRRQAEMTEEIYCKVNEGQSKKGGEKVHPELSTDNDVEKTAEIQENIVSAAGDAGWMAGQRSENKKKRIKLVGMIAAITALVFLLLLAFCPTGYEKAIENFCNALESGDLKKIESLLFERETMEGEAMQSLFDGLKYIYGEEYNVFCEDIECIERAETENFNLLNQGCERMCNMYLDEELYYTKDTKLVEIAEKSKLYEEVMSFNSKSEQLAFLARRYGGTYPVDISRFKNCEAYYVRATIVISDREGENEDVLAALFTVICKDGKYMVDRVEDDDGIAINCMGEGHLHVACENALLRNDRAFFELDELDDFRIE